MASYEVRSQCYEPVLPSSNDAQKDVDVQTNGCGRIHTPPSCHVQAAMPNILGDCSCIACVKQAAYPCSLKAGHQTPRTYTNQERCATGSHWQGRLCQAHSWRPSSKLAVFRTWGWRSNPFAKPAAAIAAVERLCSKWQTLDVELERFHRKDGKILGGAWLAQPEDQRGPECAMSIWPNRPYDQAGLHALTCGKHHRVITVAYYGLEASTQEQT